MDENLKNENLKKENEKIIKWTINHGEITQESKFWNDFEDIGEEELLKNKIIKVKIFTGKKDGKDVIVGVGFTFKSYSSGEEMPCKEHLGSLQYEDFKELDIKSDEYLTDFRIRVPYDLEYISQIGFKTSKGNELLVGKEDGNELPINSNGGDNIIIGTFGCANKKLDAIGILYVDKKQFLKRKCFALFMLNHLAKTDTDFKKETEEKYAKLEEDYKYLWKTVNLPNAIFSQVVKYCCA